MTEQLRYYPDSLPGISRRRRGRGFSYHGADGKTIRDAGEITRLKALAVPPAYTQVWISPYANSHLLATGRDDRQRKQYRYHPTWQEQRSTRKYDRLIDLGLALPALRGWIERQLGDAEAGDQEAAIAAVLALIDRGSLRIGSEIYARENASYGATTLRDRHAEFDGHGVELDFTAKGGDKVRKRINGKRLQRFLERCQDLPGAALVSWVDDDGEVRGVRSEQVQAVISEVCGEHLSPKALRTWNGSHAAFQVALAAHQQQAELTIKAMAEAASERLDNTPTIARNSYIHPAIIELAELPLAERTTALSRLRGSRHRHYRSGEPQLLAYLKRQARKR